MNTARKEHCLLSCPQGTLCIHYTPIICNCQEIILIFLIYYIFIIFYMCIILLAYHLSLSVKRQIV